MIVAFKHLVTTDEVAHYDVQVALSSQFFYIRVLQRLNIIFPKFCGDNRLDVS